MRVWLRNKRIENNVTMVQISTNLHISESHYSMIEANKRRPSVETAKKIAKVLNFDWKLFYPDDESDSIVLKDAI